MIEELKVVRGDATVLNAFDGCGHIATRNIMPDTISNFRKKFSLHSNATLCQRKCVGVN